MGNIGRLVYCAIALVGFIVTSENAHSAVIYNYKGSPFTVAYNQSPPEIYTLQNKVTVEFTLSQALLASQRYSSISPISFKISDGNQVVSDQSVGLRTLFYVETDSSGNIISWTIGANNFEVPFIGKRVGYLSTRNALDILSGRREVQDGGSQFNCLTDLCFSRNAENGGYNRGSPGMWTSLASPVPEPQSWLMMLVGFGIAGGYLRTRRKNKQQAKHIWRSVNYHFIYPPPTAHKVQAAGP